MNEKHELNLKVRYVEIDGMKIVHNSKYLVYFEEARIDLVRKEKLFLKIQFFMMRILKLLLPLVI